MGIWKERFSCCTLACRKASGLMWRTSGTNVLMRSTSSRVKRTSVPALEPPACKEVRPGKTPMICMPKLEKMLRTARPNPAPYASRSTTVAMPHAMPSMVSMVRRRLCRIAWYDWPRRSRTIVLLFPQGFHRRQHRCLARRIKSSHNSGECKRDHGQSSRCRHQSWSVKSRRRRQCAQHGHESGRSPNAQASADDGEKRAFKEKLGQDIAVGGSQGLHKPNLARTLGNRHQHDIDIPNRPQSQGEHAYATTD